MAGLSRDILKWLQSLDLSYSVKNVKRDFANGFLVAEIFSRYFPHDVQMHSFDNGISLPKKLANWELLEKFFLKKRVPIGRDMIDLVIHCKGNAALPLLETITVGPPLRPPRTKTFALAVGAAAACCRMS